MQEPFIKPLSILATLHENGYEAYFVGGAVRDLLLNRPIGDIDIATSALPEEVMSLFPRTVDVGIEHGTVIVLIENIPYEVTTFRIEEEYEDYRRPSSVSFIKSLTEDLKRRDFTMNAIAMDGLGRMIDPFNGKEAIKNGVIETVGNPNERFYEDALRMMRGIRFVSQLNFSLSALTEEAIKTNGYLLRKISVERLTKEFEKIILAHNTSEGLSLLVKTNIFKYLPNLSVYRDALNEMHLFRWNLLKDKSEAWSLFLVLLNISDIKGFLKDWKLPNKLIVSIDKNVKGLRKVQENGWSVEILYELGFDHSRQVETIRSILSSEDVENNINKIKQQYLLLPIKTRNDLVISGNDLLLWSDREPGPWVSKSLSEIENYVLRNELQNDEAKIKEWFFRCNRK
ncbi:CCA tRNA nucleotidyltransferase [Litchfieldia salsa]|uniref:CCA-adding enzyme n=1 Tax=Litchfieldia salsa TaxID=930152 RepID=A0A1H0TKJ8_9BACI|nr:CCA tRNA nucleotidyltransferase [Litchfieldia salsa]SDP54554.1 tRNA nucleotidyltransferase (CCA-adding enzyme) [Litchfieldia salsa]